MRKKRKRKTCTCYVCTRTSALSVRENLVLAVQVYFFPLLLSANARGELAERFIEFQSSQLSQLREEILGRMRIKMWGRGEQRVEQWMMISRLVFFCVRIVPEDLQPKWSNKSSTIHYTGFHIIFIHFFTSLWVHITSSWKYSGKYLFTFYVYYCY